MFRWLTKIFDMDDDPVYNCELYLDKDAGSCSHVDGPLCDFPYCTLRVDYLDSKDKGNIAIPFG